MFYTHDQFFVGDFYYHLFIENVSYIVVTKTPSSLFESQYFSYQNHSYPLSVDSTVKVTGSDEELIDSKLKVLEIEEPDKEVLTEAALVDPKVNSSGMISNPFVVVFPAAMSISSLIILSMSCIEAFNFCE